MVVQSEVKNLEVGSKIECVINKKLWGKHTETGTRSVQVAIFGEIIKFCEKPLDYLAVIKVDLDRSPDFKKYFTNKETISVNRKLLKCGS